MFIIEPFTITEMYLETESKQNKYKGLLNANFKDYLDSMAGGGQLQLKAGKLKQHVSALGAGIGMAAGALGGPQGIALGLALGSSIGKYFGNVISDRIYGQAIQDMSEINHESKVRHAQLAASVAFESQIGAAIDTLRQNENKRKKDDIQAMQV